ncbi:MAG: MASE1 domain-containing protein, partial [Bdellovibrionia bacterium]
MRQAIIEILKHTKRLATKMTKLHTVRYIVQVSVLFAAYFITGELALMFIPAGGINTLVWPPTGISLAALLLFNLRLWPGIALGAFAVNLSAGVSLPIALSVAVGSTVEVLGGAFLLKHYFVFHAALDRVKDTLVLLAVAFLGAGVSATISRNA